MLPTRIRPSATVAATRVQAAGSSWAPAARTASWAREKAELKDSASAAPLAANARIRTEQASSTATKDACSAPKAVLTPSETTSTARLVGRELAATHNASWLVRCRVPMSLQPATHGAGTTV